MMGAKAFFIPVSSSPLVSAIVLNYRSPRDTWTCVDALCKQTIADKLEILVVDNHSSDDSIGYIRNRTRGVRCVRVLESAQNTGYGQGNALGIRAAQSTYLLIVNPDTALESSALETMIAAMEADPAIGILAPRLVFADGNTRDAYRRFPTVADLLIKRTFLRRFFPGRMHRYLQDQENMDAPRDVDWVAGACFLLRRDLYKELGGFDPRFFLFFEDTDLCRRCWNAGKRVVYYPSARAFDRKKRLSDGGFLTIFYKPTVRIHLASACKYFWKWRGA